MSVSLNYAAFSDVGLVRKTNQDAAYASPHMLVLADGMGGAAAGDIASSVTVAQLAEVDDALSVDELLPCIRKAIHTAHQELMDRSFEDPSLAGLGTTCIAIMRANNKLAMAHIGDSRAYLLRNQKFTQVTHDHTLVQYLVDHGEITPEEAENHPKRNVIMRAISDAPNDLELDESVREAIPGDRWLLCSDGLFGVVSFETIRATLTAYPDLHECGENLISLALAGGAPDNVTVVLADVVDDAALPSHLRLPYDPVVVGAAARDYRKPSRGGQSAAAQAAGLIGASNSLDTDESEAALVEKRARRSARLKTFIGIFVALAALFGLGYGGYAWSQHQYYVAPAGEYVAIYQGIPQEIGSLKLSHVIQRTDLKFDNLSQVAQDRLELAITSSSLEDARATIENLRHQEIKEIK